MNGENKVLKLQYILILILSLLYMAATAQTTPPKKNVIIIEGGNLELVMKDTVLKIPDSLDGRTVRDPKTGKTYPLYKTKRGKLYYNKPKKDSGYTKKYIYVFNISSTKIISKMNQFPVFVDEIPISTTHFFEGVAYRQLLLDINDLKPLTTYKAVALDTGTKHMERVLGYGYNPRARSAIVMLEGMESTKEAIPINTIRALVPVDYGLN